MMNISKEVFDGLVLKNWSKTFRKDINGNIYDGQLTAKQKRKLAASNLGQHCDNISFTEQAVGILKPSQFLISIIGNDK